MYILEENCESNFLKEFLDFPQYSFKHECCTICGR